MYKINFSKKIIKFLQKRNYKFREKFISFFEEISANPFTEKLDIKPLKGYKKHYRLRINKYRILFKIIDSNTILCYDADSRGSVYKMRSKN